MFTSSLHRHAAVTFRAVKGGTVALDAMVTLHLSGRRAVGVQQPISIGMVAFGDRVSSYPTRSRREHGRRHI